MPELVLTILKLCLLALLYLFFLRVLRAVWVEVRSEGADVAPRSRPNSGGQAQRAPKGRATKRASRSATGSRTEPAPDGLARQGARVEAPVAVGGAVGTVAPRDIIVTNEAGRRSAPIAIGSLVTVGRAESCEIRITDSFSSQMHARVFDHDGVAYLEDLNSTNGTFLNDAKVRGTAPLHAGDVIQIGNTTLELQ